MGSSSIDMLGNNLSVSNISFRKLHPAEWSYNRKTLQSFLKLFFKIEVSLIYNVLLISAIQPSDLIIYIYTFFSVLFSILGYPRILNRVPCAKQ